MMKMRYALLCFLLVSVAQLGNATTLPYTTYSAWGNTVTGTLTKLDLSQITGGSYNTASGVTDGGYIFTGPDGTNNWSLSEANSGLLGATDGSGGVAITLPGAGQSAIFVWAAAFNPSTYNPDYTKTLSVTFSGDPNTYTLSGGAGGISSASPITSVLITAPAGYGVILYQTAFGTSTSQATSDPGQAPEAATIALVGGGILVLFGSKRKLLHRFAV